MLDVPPPVLVAMPAGLLGWLVGLLPTWLIDALEALEGSTRKRSRHVLLRDPPIQAGIAGAWAALVLTGGVTWPVLAAALAAIPVVLVGVADWRHQSVFTSVVLFGVLVAMVLSPTIHSASPWIGVVGAVVGLLGAALISAAVQLAYSGSSMGRGDLAIAAMIGAAAGPNMMVALAAGVLLSALYASLTIIAGRSRSAAIPYGPGLCLGGLLTLVVR